MEIEQLNYPLCLQMFPGLNLMDSNMPEFFLNEIFIVYAFVGILSFTRGLVWIFMECVR